MLHNFSMANFCLGSALKGLCFLCSKSRFVILKNDLTCQADGVCSSKHSIICDWMLSCCLIWCEKMMKIQMFCGSSFFFVFFRKNKAPPWCQHRKVICTLACCATPDPFLRATKWGRSLCNVCAYHFINPLSAYDDVSSLWAVATILLMMSCGRHGSFTRLQEAFDKPSSSNGAFLFKT